MNTTFRFNLNRMNETLRNRLPSDGDNFNETFPHRLNKMSLVRKSKFRHVYGCAAKKEECYEGLKIMRNVQDGNVCAVNPRFLAVIVESAGGGVFAVLPIDKIGRVSNSTTPKVCGHRGPIADIKWNPFNDYVIASSSDDTTIKVWQIPEDELTSNLTEWILDLQGHTKKVSYIEWHPTAEDILLSAGNDHKCIIWNIATAECVRIVTVHPDTIYSISWNRDGSLFATTCKDKQIRVIDPRLGTIVTQGEGHQGSKASKVIFLDKVRLFTTGFSKMSERQIAVWNIDNTFKPLRIENLDVSSGIIFPHYDYDTKIVFLAGKGDGNIRYYEMVEDAPYFHYLCQYLSSSPQRGLGLMPKRGLDVHRCEIVRFYKLHTMKDLIEPLSMIVPRKSELFQEDIFPPTSGVFSSMSATDWIDGASKDPVLVPFKEIRKNVTPSSTSTTIKLMRHGVDASEADSVHPLIFVGTGPGAEKQKTLPSSLRNIIQLSGTGEDVFWGLMNDERNKVDALGNRNPTSQLSLVEQQPQLKNFLQQANLTQRTNEKERLDNRSEVISLNNNIPHSDEYIPKGEEELRRVYFLQLDEIRHLKEELSIKEIRIQQLEEEAKALRITASNKVNQIAT